MKVLNINCTYETGSTGKIVASIHNFLLKKGAESIVLFSDGKHKEHHTIKYMNIFERNAFSLCSHILGNYGFEGTIASSRIIRIIKKENPDVVHLHNLHSHNCNLSLLFKFLNKIGIPVCYSLHDCWPFTGYCPHFASIGCDKWKTHCHNCKLFKKYSFFFDKSKKNFYKKSELLNSCNNIRFVADSFWIKSIFSSSCLSNKEIEVIYPGIDSNIFKPIKTCTNIKFFHETKINVVGIAFNFTKEKGIYDFIKLSSIVNDDINIILVGNIDKNIKLPSNIIHIENQKNQKFLAEIYSNADIFLNLTKEETFGMTNAEAYCCGTPVITYNSGGSPEIIDSKHGSVVEHEDFKSIVREIYKLGKKNQKTILECVEHSKKFTINNMCNKYFKCYEEMKGKNR